MEIWRLKLNIRFSMTSNMLNFAVCLISLSVRSLNSYVVVSGRNVICAFWMGGSNLSTHSMVWWEARIIRLRICSWMDQQPKAQSWVCLSIDRSFSREEWEGPGPYSEGPYFLGMQLVHIFSSSSHTNSGLMFANICRTSLLQKFLLDFIILYTNCTILRFLVCRSGSSIDFIILRGLLNM